MARNLDLFQKRLGYHFKDPTLLDQALLHKSAQKNPGISAFERLEFLGDRVLGLVISQWLFDVYPDETEKDLALRFSRLTQRGTLYAIAQDINLASVLTKARDGNTQKSADKILADAVESLLGGVFKDGGFRAAKTLVRRLWKPFFKSEGTNTQNPKSLLQEYIQKHYKALPTYKILDTSGPDHAPAITVALVVDHPGFQSPPLSDVSGTGASRQKAEVAAAHACLKLLQVRLS